MRNVYVLDEDLAVPIGGKKVSWYSNEQNWFFIEDGIWFMQAGIIWDGATLVPDGCPDKNKPHYPKIWLATLLHDLGRYFLDDDFPYTGKEIDQIFYEFMKLSGSNLATIYYVGVRLFATPWQAGYRLYLKVFNRSRRLPSHIDDEELTLGTGYEPQI